jgi:4-hydroxybenzoate polyprenyltransferase
VTTPPLFRALRPSQWTKNLFVVAPILFGKVAADPAAVASTLSTAVAFCALASGLYLVNDVLDREQDLAHPTKRFRPIASGALGVGAALTVSALLLAASLGATFVSAPRAVPFLVAYAALTLAYSLALKRVALLDVFVISAGFVLRVLAGSAAARVQPSHWLLLCTFFLALFLALSKRRSERAGNGDGARPSLRSLSLPLLDSLENVALGTTIVCYALYTVAPETVAWFKTDLLLATVPIVVFGLFRWRLLETRGGGENASTDLFTDPVLLLTVLAWGASCAAIVYAWPRR